MSGPSITQCPEDLLAFYLAAVYQALNHDIDILDSDRATHRATIAMFLEDPGLTAEQAHNSWVGRRMAQGWVFGRKFDPILKTHPQMKPFRDLPPLEVQAEEAGIAALRQAIGHAVQPQPEMEEL